MAIHSSFFDWKNPIGREAWQAIVQGSTKSWTRLCTIWFIAVIHQEGWGVFLFCFGGFFCVCVFVS